VKKNQTYFISFILLILFFSSCRTEETVIDKSVDTEQSMALRIVLNNFKEHTSSGKNKDNICFDFVYPIQLEYNNESNATIESLEGLLDIIYAESKELYIIAIEMPFEVSILETLTETISSEEGFFSLLADCEIDTPLEDDFFDGCFTFQYPIKVVTSNGVIHTINSNESFISFLQEFGENWWFEFVYPLTVTLEDGSIMVLENDYDLFDVLDSCFGCGCEQTYQPICVEYDGWIYEFPNECEAICAGFTSSDFVDCALIDPDGCSISNFVATAGSCNSNNTYSLTINFDYVNQTDENFLVGTTDGVIFSYALSNLPVTIPNYSCAGEVNIIILNSNNCSSVAYFEAPNCGK